MNILKTDKDNHSLLLNKFNDRDNSAFSEIYLMYYDDLFYFASNLYRNSDVSACDVVQDTFLNLWESKKQRFEGLINIKAYLFISIKNSFKNYLTHKKYIEKHRYSIQLDSDYFITQIVKQRYYLS